jgi:hypothetical protein
MKTIFTFLVAVVLSTSIFAANIFKPTSTLTIKSMEKSAIVVIVDGKRYDFGSNSIMIKDLTPSYHDVKVYRKKLNGSVYHPEKSYDVLFSSSVLLKPRTSLLIAINSRDVITMNETKVKGKKSVDNWKGITYYDNTDNIDDDNSSKAINKDDFSRVLWAISKESKESNKMLSAEQIINTNYFSTDQVKYLLQLFNSEDNKLELAKLAYGKTVDQYNYYTLNNIFKFNSSKDELARCVASY